MKGNAKSEPGELGLVRADEKGGGRGQGRAGDALRQRSDGECYIFSVSSRVKRDGDMESSESRSQLNQTLQDHWKLGKFPGSGKTVFKNVTPSKPTSHWVLCGQTLNNPQITKFDALALVSNYGIFK